MIIECDFKLFMQHVMTKLVSKDIQQLNAAQVLAQGLVFFWLPIYLCPTDPEEVNQQVNSDLVPLSVNSYLDLLVITALRYCPNVSILKIQVHSRESS